MENDLYFDCPVCSHTLKVDTGLVGQLVQCPDCDGKIEVPDIRDGLNPRFKSGTATNAPPGKTPADASPRAAVSAELLLENLASLYRRREEQGRQLDYIRSNAELCLKQIQLLQTTSPPELLPHHGGGISAPSPDSENRNSFLLLSVGFGLITLLAGIIVLALL